MKNTSRTKRWWWWLHTECGCGNKRSEEVRSPPHLSSFPAPPPTLFLKKSHNQLEEFNNNVRLWYADRVVSNQGPEKNLACWCNNKHPPPQYFFSPSTPYPHLTHWLAILFSSTTPPPPAPLLSKAGLALRAPFKPEKKSSGPPKQCTGWIPHPHPSEPYSAFEAVAGET